MIWLPQDPRIDVNSTGLKSVPVCGLVLVLLQEDFQPQLKVTRRRLFPPMDHPHRGKSVCCASALLALLHTEYRALPGSFCSSQDSVVPLGIFCSSEWLQRAPQANKLNEACLSLPLVHDRADI